MARLILTQTGRGDRKPASWSLAPYVARMEDVLDLYAEEPDHKRPVVCFEESPTQLIGEVRQAVV